MNCIFYTTADEIAAIRPVLQPVFEEMLRRTPCLDFVADDLFALDHVILGAVYYGDVVMLAGAFEFRHYPRHLAVNIMALGGKNMRAAMGMYWDKFQDWCRTAGATVIEADCGDAMTRLLERQGFTHTQNRVRQIL